MQRVSSEVLGADWQPYRIYNTDEPLQPNRPGVGGSDDVVFVYDVVRPERPAAVRRVRHGWDVEMLALFVICFVLIALGLWKLWELTGLALSVLLPLLGG